jgi:hypothetical protein
MSHQLPPGWQQRNLDEILEPEQFQQVELIMKKHQRDPDAALPELKRYFRSIEPHLAANGIVPDYFAYVMYAKMVGII